MLLIGILLSVGAIALLLFMIVGGMRRRKLATVNAQDFHDPYESAPVVPGFKPAAMVVAPAASASPNNRVFVGEKRNIYLPKKSRFMIQRYHALYSTSEGGWVMDGVDDAVYFFTDDSTLWNAYPEDLPDGFVRTGDGHVLAPDGALYNQDGTYYAAPDGTPLDSTTGEPLIPETYTDTGSLPSASYTVISEHGVGQATLEGNSLIMDNAAGADFADAPAGQSDFSSANNADFSAPDPPSSSYDSSPSPSYESSPSDTGSSYDSSPSSNDS